MQYHEKCYKYLTATNELNVIEKKAIEQLNKNQRLPPATLVYTKQRLYWITLRQFDNSSEAKRNVFQLFREKHADFYITAGLSKNPHPLDSNTDQMWLNIILSTKVKTIKRQLELHFSADSVTVLKRNVTEINDKMELACIQDAVSLEDAVDTEESIKPPK